MSDLHVIASELGGHLSLEIHGRVQHPVTGERACIVMFSGILDEDQVAHLHALTASAAEQPAPLVAPSKLRIERGEFGFWYVACRTCANPGSAFTDYASAIAGADRHLASVDHHRAVLQAAESQR